ncbi:MAG: hypothetical protein QOJ72_2609 [Nocardioidaceae bacterium]|nr:hypothetical protein [Nocardioidaceae bacterium]
MRALGLALVAVAMLLAGMQPAAASSTPSKVGLVSFVAASFSATADPGVSASLTIDWPGASHARSYEIFMSRHNDMSHAKKFTSRSSTLRVSHLRNGTDYFFQVRGVNGSRVGAKSAHVGHTTIRDKGSAHGTAYRVMTYNVCSRVCDEQETTPYTWSKDSPHPSKQIRQPGALERVAAYAPDVLATQEANYLVTPPGYTKAVDQSAKELFFKTARFDQATGLVQESQSCGDTSPPGPAVDGPRAGFVCLGRHGGGDRYAAWVELVDKTNGKHVIFVDVHTVTGDNLPAATDRKAEMRTLFTALGTINPGSTLPVVFAGDFNSHKNRSHDYVATVMHQNGYYDAFDLAMTLKRQHINSYNDFQTVPKLSYTWGDHVDHVWVRPGSSRVEAWRNGALIVDGRLPKPIPSDHSPVVVDLLLD